MFAKILFHQEFSVTMTVQEAFSHSMHQVQSLYDSREAAAIANLLIEHITGLSRIDRVIYNNKPLEADQQARLESCIQQLLAHRPLQYVIEESWFYGMQFYVNEHVLIPRPETEELVQWVLEEQPVTPHATIIDIGTGSGCIPISIQKNWPAAKVYAIDVSEDALAVAQRNADKLQASVQFIGQDILQPGAMDQLPQFDIIVSNPPYIKEQESADMQAHVLQYEPALALFVPDTDPLLFYRTIAELGKEKLQPNGKLFFEINEAHGEDTMQLMRSLGYKNVILRQDIFGKDRMVCGML
ncbi:peptide chain release factor N(5)-glutamine methyltransferase [Chitinophaga skermanii]|nr:peptide chain release factor N(5)-glutamine methyltransferase [Chitinophaga skermanii]